MHRGFNKGLVSARSFLSVEIETGREKKANGRKTGSVLERGEKWERTSGGRRWRTAGAWLPRVASSLYWTLRGRESSISLEYACCDRNYHLRMPASVNISSVKVKI